MSSSVRTLHGRTGRQNVSLRARGATARHVSRSIDRVIDRGRTAAVAEDDPVPAPLSEDTFHQAQAGERRAVNAVYESLAPAVRGYLLARGAVDPDGLTSDVFLAVLPKLPTVIGGVAGLRTFVFSVAHARLVDERRWRSRHPDAEPYLPEHDRRTARSAEEIALEAEGERWVRSLLDEVAADQAEVLTLRVLADLSIEQTAEVMGRSPGAIKQLQRRALLSLRGILAARGVTR
jgi:RNA polymerase sigma-70 factor (ECF subfamily)